MALMPCKGERPWLPSDRASDLNTLLEVDHPLVGTFQNGPDRYLFTCLLGDLGRLEVWAYAPYSAADAAFVQSRPFRKPRDLRQWTEAKVLREATRVALSWDGVLQSHADVGGDDTIAAAVNNLLDAFNEAEEIVKAAPLRVKSAGPLNHLLGIEAFFAVGSQRRDDRDRSAVRVAVEQTSEEARELVLPF